MTKKAANEMIARLLSETAAIGTGSDAAIDDLLAAIGRFSSVDRVYFFQLDPQARRFNNTHAWCADGIDPLFERLQAIDVEKELPWLWEHIAAGELLSVADVADLPAAAASDKTRFEGRGIQSLMAVPVFYQGQATGFLWLARNPTK